MKKKSHISVAKYLVNSTGMESLLEHKKAFYFGSILPDCTISFLTRRHSVEETFHILEEEIKKITEDYDYNKGINGYFCRHLGIVTHYIGDYFTFPHNTFYNGTMREHCRYEKELKSYMVSYIKSQEPKKNKDRVRMHTVEDICTFIQQMHKKYEQDVKVIKIDCEYIIALCRQVVEAILCFFEERVCQNVYVG